MEGHVDYKPQVGDIVLMDSQKLGARIVKYLMRSPTVWQDLWRKFVTHNLKFIPYYHVAMIYGLKEDPSSIGYSDWDIIEQQSKVQIKNWRPDNIQIIFRRKNVTPEYKSYLAQVSRDDLGKGYDILSIFGKTATWLTGIPFFAWFVQWPGAEICVNRVAMWHYKVFGEKFAQVTIADLTTQEMYEYLMKSFDYEVVYTKP